MAKTKKSKKAALRRRPPATPGYYAYTLLDEMTASPIMPMPREHTNERANMARFHLQVIRDGHGTRDEWLTLATIVNVFEVMLDEGFVKDPDDLIGEVTAILLRAFNSYTPGYSTMELDAAGYFHLNAMLTDWEECLQDAPARVIIRSMRLTEARKNSLGRRGINTPFARVA
jgi:hypothetical protein